MQGVTTIWELGESLLNSVQGVTAIWELGESLLKTLVYIQCKVSLPYGVR